ncbi:MAG: hypothetical protein HY422_00560 [Candidatus Komeilibacteria bacterium]|nr:hypothetical protein [Candidatus Komeilibacteria bacterium]
MLPISEWGLVHWIAFPLCIVWFITGFVLFLNFNTVIKLRGRSYTAWRVVFYTSWAIWLILILGPKYLQLIQSWF